MSAEDSARSIEPIVANYVATELVYEREEREVAPDEQLLGGLLDSIAILNLVEFLQDEFGIRVEDDELVPENFETVKAVATLVARKRAAADPG